MMFGYLSVLLLCAFVFALPVLTDETCSKTNCALPCCQCPISNDNPTSFNTTDLPQLILLTFVGNLNSHSLDSIRTILNPAHRNPNKCPISSTFFVNDNYTDYCFIQRLFDNHNEIAITTSSNRCPLTNCYDENQWRRWIKNDWQREIKQQRTNVIEQARIHHSHVKGFRVPHLEIDEFQHLEIIRRFHFHYDSSMLFKASNLQWPFTMNHQWNHTDCVNCDESMKNIETIWQFPLHEWSYPNATRSCRTFADVSCFPTDQVHSVDLFYNFLMHNFERHASSSIGHRSPFIIELDLFWLSEQKQHRLEALIRFIEYLLNSKDHRYVYFVSIEQALEWMKYPRPVSELEDFWAFSCTNTIYEYDIECSEDGTILKGDKNGKAIAEKLLGKNDSNDTLPQDRRAEDLFRSGIVVNCIWAFLLLIFGVIFYDKYFTSK